jgi:hypothetical protein
MNNWTDPRHRKFAEDLEGMDYSVEEYHGRWGYHGPAVRVDASELQDVLRATPVRVIWDTLGKSGLVIYPDCRQRIEDEMSKLDFARALEKGYGINMNGRS